MPKARHVASYFGARNSVNGAKKKYGGKVVLHLVIKDGAGNIKKTHENVDSVDKYIPEAYNEKTLAAKLADGGN